ncbi:hypothetical protein K2173_008935 [Erythroxylum novogranatense]|uniref:DUF6821 domain-containing protein n=1 Tax=Erythroxylum novogranatense TaxID=1862640 RepID=A0AAV8TUI9_9ROSI|nr:hypothetical protein K2173_008935 [Erythroxylum novogranatense]
MEGETECHDWEILVKTDSEAVKSPNSVDNSRGFEEIGADSESMIRLDYFSLENDGINVKSAVVDASDGGSVESDNPSWIDPGSDFRSQRRISCESWSDSGSDRSEERKFSEVDAIKELGFSGYAKTELDFEGISEIRGNKGGKEIIESFEDKIRGVEEKSELVFEDNMKSQVGFEVFEETKSEAMGLAEFRTNSGGDGVVPDDVGKARERAAVSDELDGGKLSGEGSSSVVAVDEKQQPGGHKEEKRKVAWWKVPFEVLKFCVFRVNPIWTFSMAAAVMGFVILGRKLYKMKHKTRTLQLKVAVDDKKVSQVMSRAARFNEAFSVVRRVPIVRPLLPAAVVNPWPVVSLR